MSNEIVNNLVAQGIPKAIAERIAADAAKADTPKKKEKKPGRYFPGMSDRKKKVDITVDVLVVCECCGAAEATTKVIQGNEDSPTSMKVATSICSKCPDYLRQFSHEQLVALVLAKEHPGIKRDYKMNRSHVQFATKHTPEEIVTLKLRNF